MKCLYCGGPLTLALLKKITGAGEFCSDECRRGYQSEFNRLAVGRLQQARAGRRVSPLAGGLSLPDLDGLGADAPEMPIAQMRPISEVATVDLPEPVYAQTPLPPPAVQMAAPVAEAPVAEVAFVTEVLSPTVPVLDSRPETAAPPEKAPGSAPVPVPVPAAQEEEAEVWMAPRGLFPLTLRVQAVATKLRMPTLSPAPIFVYLQLPESLIASSIGRPQLSTVGVAQPDTRIRLPLEEPRFASPEPMAAGLRLHLSSSGPARVPERQFASPAGFGPDCAQGLVFPWPQPASLVPQPSLRFQPSAAVALAGLDVDLAPADPRFGVYLKNDGREELRAKLRDLSDRRAQQRKLVEDGPTVTLPIKTVEPALNVLAAFGTAMLERQNRLGDLPPGVLTPPSAGDLPADELLPRLVAGLQATPPAFGEARPPVPPQQPQQPAQNLMPAAPAPATGPDGLPSGWPADMPPPSALVPQNRAPSAPAAPEALVAAPPAGNASPMPGMPPINGNVYMFGTEINADAKDGENTSTALTKTGGGDLEKPASQEPESTEPNFTRPGGYPLAGGGMMNVGTMVVVNQPSGTVNINANSATASTFESRLRQKEPSPLASIAEPVGLQVPPPQPAKDMPLRMNFQGRLDSAMPIQWPEWEPIPMRKKVFFGAPQRLRRGPAAEPHPAPASPPPPIRRSAAPPVPEPAEAQPDKSGAMGWIKSISNRFGKK